MLAAVSLRKGCAFPLVPVRSDIFLFLLRAGRCFYRLPRIQGAHGVINRPSEAAQGYTPGRRDCEIVKRWPSVQTLVPLRIKDTGITVVPAPY